MKQYKFTDIELVLHFKLDHQCKDIKEAEYRASEIVKNYKEGKILTILNKNPLMIFYDDISFHIVIVKIVSYLSTNQNILLIEELNPLFPGLNIEVQEETYRGDTSTRVKKSIGTILKKIVINKKGLSFLKFTYAYVNSKVIFDYAGLTIEKKPTRAFTEENFLYDPLGNNSAGTLMRAKDDPLLKLAINMCLIFPDKAKQLMQGTGFENLPAIKNILEGISNKTEEKKTSSQLNPEESIKKSKNTQNKSEEVINLKLESVPIKGIDESSERCYPQDLQDYIIELARTGHNNKEIAEKAMNSEFSYTNGVLCKDGPQGDGFRKTIGYKRLQLKLAEARETFRKNKKINKKSKTIDNK